LNLIVYLEYLVCFNSLKSCFISSNSLC